MPRCCIVYLLFMLHRSVCSYLCSAAHLFFAVCSRLDKDLASILLQLVCAFSVFTVTQSVLCVRVCVCLCICVCAHACCSQTTALCGV